MNPSIRTALTGISEQNGFSPDAVAAMWHTVIQGRGGMAQFDHPEFGGAGQWMRGGMTMVSDTFNQGLRRRVDALCDELAALLEENPGLLHDRANTGKPAAGMAEGTHAAYETDAPGAAESPVHWWPGALGIPASSGSQNGTQYAYFADQHRLAVECEGQITVYDTHGHHIGGVSQQPGPHGSLVFSSQHGLVDLERLPVIQPQPPAARQAAAAAVGHTVSTQQPSNHVQPEDVLTAAWLDAATDARQQTEKPLAKNLEDILSAIDRLSDLHQRGVLTAQEFSVKKAELLDRI